MIAVDELLLLRVKSSAQPRMLNWNFPASSGTVSVEQVRSAAAITRHRKVRKMLEIQS